MNTGFGASRGSLWRLQSACCRLSREEPSASAPRRALRAFPPSGAGASAPVRSQRERRDGRWGLALTHTARQVMATAKTGASRTCPTTGKERSAVPIVHPAALAKRQPRAVRSDATCTAGWPDGWPEPSVGTFFYAFAPLGPSSHEWTPRACGAGLSQMIHARPPRWRLGDAHKRMPCAFLCSSCESLTCLLHDSARAAAVVGAWNGHPAGWMHTSTPPSRRNLGEGTT